MFRFGNNYDKKKTPRLFFTAKENDLHHQFEGVVELDGSHGDDVPMHLLGEGYMYTMNIDPLTLKLLELAIAHGKRLRSAEFNRLLEDKTYE